MGGELAITTIGELVEANKAILQTGPFGTVLKAEEYSNEGVPLISVKEIGYGNLRVTDDTPKVDEKTTNRLSKYILQKGDIVFGRKGGVDRNAIITEAEHGWFLGSDGIFLRLANTDDAYFVSFVLRSPATKAWLLQNCEGTTMPSLNQKILSRLPLYNPGASEKKKITYVLRHLDDKIALNHQMNQTLEEMAQALFKSWFVDFDPVIDNALEAGSPIPESLAKRAETRKALKESGEAPALPEAIRSLFPDAFRFDEVMGWIPEEWENLSAQTVSNVTIGKTPPRKETEWFSGSKQGNIIWASIKDLGRAGTYLRDSSEYLTQAAVDKFNIRVVPKDAVVLSFKLTLGRVCITHEPLTTNEAIAHFSNYKSGLNSAYLCCYLKGFDFNSLGSTSSIATAVNSKIIKAMPILVPSADLLAKFSELVSGIFNRINSSEKENQSLTALRDTLLPKLISGELKIPEAEEMVAEAN